MTNSCVVFVLSLTKKSFGISMAFERWQQQLYELLLTVTTKRHNYEQAASTCKTLMKPWPRKTTESDEHKVKAPEKKATADPQEEAELKLVSDILSKAQKTRVKNQSRLQKFKEDSEDENSSNNNESSEKQELWEVCDTDSKQEKSPRSSLDANIDGTGDLANLEPVPVIEAELKTVRQDGRKGGLPAKSVPQSGPRKPVSQASGRNNDSAVARRQGAPAVTNKAMSGKLNHPTSVQMQQKQTSSSRPGSAQGKFKPAHMTAPFKTDPNTRVPKRPNSKIHPLSSAQRSSWKAHIRSSGVTSNKFNVLPPVSRTSSAASSENTDCGVVECVSLAPSSVRSDQVTAQNDCDSDRPLPYERAGNMNECVASVSDTSEDVASSHLSQLTLSSKLEKQHKEAARNLQDTSEKQGAATYELQTKKDIPGFSLLTDGHSLNIPAKVRRTYAKNHQLRTKASQGKVDTRRKPPDTTGFTGLAFCEKVEQLFDTEPELLYRQQAVECLGYHDQLLQTLEQLHLETISASSSPKEILRAKVMAEYVLSSFSDLSDSAELFSKVQFPQYPKVTDPSVQQSKWHNFSQAASVNADERGETPSLQYTSAKDLHQYYSQLLRLQTLQCQQHILSLLDGELLPWVEQRDSRHEDFGVIFQGMFSLMTSDGQHLPALIQESPI